MEKNILVVKARKAAAMRGIIGAGRIDAPHKVWDVIYDNETSSGDLTDPLAR